MSNYADVKTSSVLFAGLVGTLATVVAVLALSVLAFRQVNAHNAAAALEPVPELQALRAAQQAKLAGRTPPGMSIEQAMQLTVAALNAAPPPEAPHGK